MNFKILNYDEESKLSLEEKREYYLNLRNYLSNLKIKNYNFQELINKYVRFIIDKIKGYDLIITGRENIVFGPVIYASTHQDFHDHFNVVLSVLDHSIILNTSNVTRLFKMLMSANGIIYVDRDRKDSRFNAKLDMMSVLAQGKSVVVFPEATWNCSPNKLHLPFHNGIFDMARKMEVPIIPMIQEYTYDPRNKGINNVVSCHVHFAEPIYVNLDDDINVKKEELSKAWASVRYKLIEEKGIYSRTNITNKEYINYVESRIKGWKVIKVAIDSERKEIYGYNKECYVFNHINDILYNESGELLPTLEVQKLERIKEKHIYN